MTSIKPFVVEQIDLDPPLIEVADLRRVGEPTTFADRRLGWASGQRTS